MRYEVEIDTKIAAAWGEFFAAGNRIESAVDMLHIYVGDYRQSVNQYNVSLWTMTLDRVLSTEPQPWYASHFVKQKNNLTVAQEAHRAAAASISALEKLYTGWSRFFLVANAGGHIHSSMTCSTCFPTTRYGWLPQLSGLSEADAVADQGPRLCSICFPSAPVEWTQGLSKAKKELCPGSGRLAVEGHHHWAACPECRKTVFITKFRTLRAHSPKKG